MFGQVQIANLRFLRHSQAHRHVEDRQDGHRGHGGQFSDDDDCRDLRPTTQWATHRRPLSENVTHTFFFLW